MGKRPMPEGKGLSAEKALNSGFLGADPLPLKHPVFVVRRTMAPDFGQKLNLVPLEEQNNGGAG